MRRSLWTPQKKAERAEEEEKIAKAFDGVGGSRYCFSISKTEFGPLMEAMRTSHCEEAHRRTINKLEVDRDISKKEFCYWYMDWLFGDESDSDRCTEGGDSIQENTSET